MSSKQNGILIGAIAAVLVVAGLVVVIGNRSKTANNISANPRQTDQPVVGETAPNAVTMKDLSFAPASITVKKGTTVTWTNQDDAHHNVVSDDGSPDGGPSGALIGKGEQFSFTFNTVGTYKYHCSPHPFMHGTVVVTE